MSRRPKPTLVQLVGYMVGKPLPPELREWVRSDLTSRGATLRYVGRIVIPEAILLSLFLLMPGPVWVSLAMMTLLCIPMVYFSISLQKVWRQHLLEINGLDPSLTNERARLRDAAIRYEYERRHGRIS
jgi:hypothetical protein